VEPASFRATLWIGWVVGAETVSDQEEPLANKKTHALGLRTPLTPDLVQDIVVANTPDPPAGQVDPGTQLLKLGVVDDDAEGDLQAGVQSDLNKLGWHIKQADIDASKTTSVAGCRNSVLANAF
jgi:hypothetical protein